MFDVLIREAGARFGLGDKALPLLQMLLAYMIRKDTGGLAGFLEKFKAAGLGPIIQSWLGGGPAAQPISNSQLETALGGDGGLLSLLTAKLGVGRDSVTSAVGYLVPAIVGKLTPGGSIPSSLSPEVQSLAAVGQGLLDAAPVASAAPVTSGGFAKWLPWIIVALAALFGLSYFAMDRGAETPVEQAPAPAATTAQPPAADAASEPAAAEPAASEPAASEPAASEPAASEPTASEPAVVVPAASEPTAASEPASAAEATPAPASEPASAAEAGAAAGSAATAAIPSGSDEPTGAAVVASSASDMPALTVYFDSGASDVHADFAAKSADLVAFMQANPDVQAVISGYNDPTGDTAANAELSRNRAQAVQAALVAQGVAEGRTVLEKPAETSGMAATHAASRRVEVVLRK